MCVVVIARVRNAASVRLELAICLAPNSESISALHPVALLDHHTLPRFSTGQPHGALHQSELQSQLRLQLDLACR